jgi:hypothetical protein
MIGMPALSRVVVVGAADEDRSVPEAHVALPEPEQLALPHSGEERGREERPPMRVKVGEEVLGLFRLEVLRRALRNLPALDQRGRVPAGPEIALDGAGEDGVDEAAKVIQRPRGELVGLGDEKSFEARRRDLAERQVAESRQQVLARDLVDVRRAPAAAVLVPPP